MFNRSLYGLTINQGIAMTYKIAFRAVCLSLAAAFLLCAGGADFGVGGGDVDPNNGVNAYLNTFNPVLNIKVSPRIGGKVLTFPPPGSDGTYRYGDIVTVKAVPNSGYEFKEWSGASTDAVDSIRIVMDGNKTLTAIFRPKDML
jgi:uncharacterized repeat protein (TIGR02543 family)